LIQARSFVNELSSRPQHCVCSVSHIWKGQPHLC